MTRPLEYVTEITVLGTKSSGRICPTFAGGARRAAPPRLPTIMGLMEIISGCLLE